MFKKITAVLAATIALVLVGSSLSPAIAAGAASNPGSLTFEKASVEWVLASATTTQRTFTVNIPSNTKQATVGFNYRISQAAQTRIINAGGQTFETKITVVGPNGQTLAENNDSQLGLYQAQSGNWSQGYNYTYVRTLNLTSGMNTGEARGNVTFQLGTQYASNQVIPAGVYTFTTSILADGVEVTPTLYDSGQDSIGLIGAGATLITNGALESVFPSGATIRPTAKICVDTTQIHTGDSITVTHIVNGVPQTRNTTSEWTRRSNPNQYLTNYSTNPQQGPSAATTETRVLEEADVTYGLKIVPSYWTTFTSDGTNVFTYDMSVYNETTSTEVSKNCAPAAPSTPTLVMDSRTSWNAIIATANVPNNSRIYGYLYKASDLNTVVDDCTAWVSSASTTCWGYVTSPGVDLGVDYVVKARLYSDDGYSPYSASSTAVRVTGPPAPTNAPVLAVSSISHGDVTITSVQGAYRYKIALFNTNDLTNPVYTTNCYNAPNCYVDGTDLFAGPGNFVVKYAVENNSNLVSEYSPASNQIAGYTPGTTITTSPSGLTTAGKVRVSVTLGSILASSATNFATENDGRGGMIYVTRVKTQNASQFTLGRIKNDQDALDTSVGGGSPVTWSNTNPDTLVKAPTWFGSSKTSWVHISENFDDGEYTVVEGTLSSSTVTSHNANFTAICADSMSQNARASSVDVIAAPTTRPVAIISCSQSSNMNSSVYALVAARYETDGSLTNLGKLTENTSTNYQRTWSQYGASKIYSVNPSANGSQIAIIVNVVGLKAGTTPSEWNPNEFINDIDTRKLVRIPANVSSSSDITKVNNGITEGSNENDAPDVSLAPINDGTTLYLISSLYSGGGCTGTPPNMVCSPPVVTRKLYSASVASGAFANPKAITLQSGLSASGTDIIFANGFQPNDVSGGITEIAVILSARMCSMNAPCTTQTGLGRINASTGLTNYVELTGFSTSGNPISMTWLNNSGNLKQLVTEPNATGHKILETKSLLGFVPTPVVPVAVPTIQSFDVTASIDAGGGTVTIIGTNLANVQKIAFGAYEFAPASKSATKVTFKVPSKVAAGGQSSVQVAIRYGTGAGTLMPTNRTFTYVGATKLPLAISLNTGADTYLPGAQPRNVIASLSSGNNPVMLAVTVVSKTLAICTVVQGQLSFVGNGKCIVEATQPGNAAYEAATKVTKEIWVTPDYDGASTLYSTDAAKPSVTLTGTGLSSVTSVELVNPANPSEKITVTGSANIKPNATGTQLTVKLPDAGVLAGDTADLKLVWGPNTTTPISTGDTFEFVGATKLNQVIDFATVGLPATYGDAIRTLNPVSKDGSTVLDVVVSLKSTTPAVCSVTGYDVRFLSNGACKIVASQAGNAGINKAADVTMQFQVSKKAQTITIDDSTLSTTDAAEAISSGASVDNDEMALEYYSGNEDVCTVDGAGFITGLQPTNGTDKRCVITVKQPGDLRYSAATDATLEVVITSGAEPSDEAAAESDGILTPVSIVSGGANTFTATNDPSFELSWDKATGKLIPRAKGVYTGFILAKISFTKSGVTYTCTNVFGSNAAMKNVKPAEKKAAKAMKTFTTKAAFCADKAEIKPTLFTAVTGGLNRANFAKIKPANNAKKISVVIPGTPAVTKYESDAAAQLKGLTAPLTVTIEIIRFRAWPTTGVNYTGDKSKVTGGKKIPVTKRTTVVRLPN